MKISTIVSVAAATAALVSTGLSANYSNLVEQGYRWISVDGPYGCPSQDDLQQITKNRGDLEELQMVEQLRAYYIVRGALVHVVKEDATSGLTQIQIPGISSELWTRASFLSKRPIVDAYGVIETPETSGLIQTATTGIGTSQSDANPAPSASPGPTEMPTPSMAATPAASPAPNANPVRHRRHLH